MIYDVGTYSDFTTVVQPSADVIQGVDGALRSNCHRFNVVGTEELMALICRGGMTPIFSKVEN